MSPLIGYDDNAPFRDRSAFSTKFRIIRDRLGVFERFILPWGGGGVVIIHIKPFFEWKSRRQQLPVFIVRLSHTI